MDFKNHLTTQVSLRVIALTAELTFLVYLVLQTDLVATPMLVLLVCIAQTLNLIRYSSKTDRDLARFFESVKFGDFSPNFSSGGRGMQRERFAESLNDLIEAFRLERSEKESQYRYLETAIQHVSVALLAFDYHGTVTIMNRACQHLLGTNRVINLTDLNALSPDLEGALRSIVPGDEIVVKTDLLEEPSQLSISAVQIKYEGRLQTLVSIYDLHETLSGTEIEAWQKLIRVLTHEIMNSITPIASLSKSLSGMLPAADQNASISPENLDDLRIGMDTIGGRSEGLLHFVDAYRNLTKIPKPSFAICSVSHLIEEATALLAGDINENGVHLTTEVTPESLEITADEGLVGQVLVNLVKNAIDAIKGKDTGKIDITASLNKHGKIVVRVADNGPGVSREIIDQAFIPFFTTKSTGSGIGLALSREIMQMHKGSISFTSTVGKGSAILLRF